MFPFFGFDREQLFKEGQQKGGRTMFQTQAGLLLVDAANTTLRSTFFEEWAACAANDDCLLPDKVTIDKSPRGALAVHNISGHRVFRRVSEWGVVCVLCLALVFPIGTPHWMA
jgi:hypothetical protein